jgi:phage baseplate assembly protein W
MSKYMGYPFQVNAYGRTTVTSRNEHVRDMIKQLLFTNPGERVNRPDFGCGLLQLVFGLPNDALMATVQYSVHGALQRWLGDIIEVQEVSVRQGLSELEEGMLHVTVVYVRMDSGELLSDVFEA